MQVETFPGWCEARSRESLSNTTYIVHIIYSLVFSIPASGHGSFLLLGKPLKSRDHTTPHAFGTHRKTHLCVRTYNSVKYSDMGLLQIMQVENKEGFKSRSRSPAASTSQVCAPGPLSLYHRPSWEMRSPHLPL